MRVCSVLSFVGLSYERDLHSSVMSINQINLNLRRLIRLTFNASTLFPVFILVV